MAGETSIWWNLINSVGVIGSLSVATWTAIRQAKDRSIAVSIDGPPESDPENYTIEISVFNPANHSIYLNAIKITKPSPDHVIRVWLGQDSVRGVVHRVIQYLEAGSGDRYPLNVSVGPGARATIEINILREGVVELRGALIWQRATGRFRPKWKHRFARSVEEIRNLQHSHKVDAGGG